MAFFGHRDTLKLIKALVCFNLGLRGLSDFTFASITPILAYFLHLCVICSFASCLFCVFPPEKDCWAASTEAAPTIRSSVPRTHLRPWQAAQCKFSRHDDTWFLRIFLKIIVYPVRRERLGARGIHIPKKYSLYIYSLFNRGIQWRS